MPEVLVGSGINLLLHACVVTIQDIEAGAQGCSKALNRE